MIFERQFKAILANELLKYLLEGRVPNIDELSEKINRALDKDGKVTYQYVSQPSRSVFNIELYNKALNRIKFDIDLFQEELLDLLSQSTKRISYADLYHKVNSYELTRLKSKLDSILFTIENADFYFLGAFDNFSDTSKIDNKKSTPSVLNLSERCLHLPYGKSGVQKVKISHLNSFNTWPVKITVPEKDNIISFKDVPGTSFSNIFIDTTSAWAMELKTKQPGPAEIKFVFPLAGLAQEEIEVLINKIELVSHSTSKQLVKLRVSTDDVNYLPLVGYESGILMDTIDKVYSMDFETNLVQFIEVTLRKESPDAEVVEEGNKAYQYIFGLKSFSAFTIGRILTASYISKPFTFDSEEGKISKVSIQSNYERPKDTNISFFVGKEENGITQFVPINPIGKPTISGLSDTVVFSKNIQNSKKFTVDVAGPGAATPYGDPFQGKLFYKYGPVISPKPIFGSVKLFRGYNSWYRDVSTAFEVNNVVNNYISFSATDTESLSVYIEEKNPPYENILDATSGERAVIISTSKFPYFNSARGHALKSNTANDPYSDIRPNYTVYKVYQDTNTPRLTKPFSLTTSRTVQLPSFNFILNNGPLADQPAVTSDSGSILYTSGVDYIFETEDIGGSTKPTGRLLIPDGSSFLDANGNIATPNLQLKFIYTNDPDITHKITRIEGKQVTLKNALISAGDRLSINYRFIPVSPDEIQKASILVYDLPSQSSIRKSYTEGTDYSVNARTGTIQRIDSGSIPEKGSIYVDYIYRQAKAGMNTFMIWAEVTNPNGIQIKFELDSNTKKNKLSIDTVIGESFYVNSPQGLLDLSKSTNTPQLGPGWVQFVVRSKDPDTNSAFGSNLIDQIIQLRDSSKRRIFKEGNSYFNQLIAYREPMLQKTLSHLRVNVLLNDHSSFAVDDFTDPNNSYIVTNYKPTTTTELYNRVPSPDADVDARPPLSGETYLLSWDSKSQNIDDSGSNIIIRIDLERSVSSSEGLGPKVFGYSLRAST